MNLLDHGSRPDPVSSHLRVVARLGADIRAQEGETIDLSVERGDVHLFDSETGENITPVVS
ncbi:hypothetical protein [Candidatus Thiosymbion oneisti]|uniref:hypothetical protein n=1 Tax=Candidatus Thiosymbion oneisti TaxID=589554 RepID=UPI001A9CA0AF|nr:hypothetical protein [Candidatus Thiosymbion oneisti]